MNRIYVIAALSAAIILQSCGSGDTDFDACGQINATEITVAAESSGKITSLDLSEGDEIGKGQIVGFVDSVQTFLKKEELLSRRQGAETKKIDIKCQMASEYERLASLERDLERFRNLLSKDAGTRKQVDDTESQIDILKSQIKAAEQKHRQNNDNIANEIRTLDIQIAQSQDQLEKCRIVSPAEGTVMTKYAEEGETVSSGKPLFKIADLKEVYVKAYFSTAQLASLKLGDKVTVIPDDGSANPKEYEGTLRWISDEAEFTPKNIQTRDERADLVYATKIYVKNDGRLRLGMYAYIKTGK